MNPEDIEISMYLQQPPSDPERTRSIEGKLEELKRSGLGIEKLAKELLQAELLQLTYPRISEEFLNNVHMLREETEVEGTGKSVVYEVKVPAFAIFSPTSSSMVIQAGMNGGSTFNYQLIMAVSEPQGLPEIIMSHYAKNIDLSVDGVPFGITQLSRDKYGNMISVFYDQKSFLKQLAKDKRKQLKNSRLHVIAKTSCQCLVPQDVKDRMVKIGDTFEKIYFGMKTTPEDWGVNRKMVKAPKEIFIIGIYENSLYYLGSFTPIPLGTYVSNIGNARK